MSVHRGYELTTNKLIRGPYFIWPTSEGRTMSGVSLQVALDEQAYNANLAEQNPENQEKFMAEFMYSDPNNFEEMKELYEAYGYKYSRDLWALQMVAFKEADRKDQQNIDNI